MTHQIELPMPDHDACEHSARLVARIRQEMDQAGHIPFEQYMGLALYAPGLGYYSGPLRKFGEKGDFVTAPEISPLFSRCLARQCAEVLDGLGGGDILELGAGSGVMAVELLLKLEHCRALPNHYYILELSAHLQERQRTTLAEHASHLLNRVTWLSAFPAKKFSGIILANEVLDAMPVCRFRYERAGLKEFFVRWEGDRFEWQIDAARPIVQQRFQQLNLELSDRYESEISLAHGPWIKGLSDVLNKGLILLIDYGFPRSEFYHPDRSMGTLMCHYQHRTHDDPLILHGLQDITAHVDFTAIAEAAVASDLSVAGYTTQAHFLLATGITEFINDEQIDAKAQFNLSQQIKKLTLPSEMGELFKVIALTRDLNTPLMGFQLNDQRGRL